MTTIEEAIIKIRDIDPHQGHHTAHFTNWVASPSGKVVIRYLITRGVLPCPICGKWTGMGTISIQHRDGRIVRLNPGLYHYVDARHPISKNEVEAEQLIAIIDEAEDWSADLNQHASDTRKLEEEAIYLGVLTARKVKPLSRLEYDIKGDILNLLFGQLQVGVLSVTRIAQNGAKIAHWIIGKNFLTELLKPQSPIEQYVSEFGNAPLTIETASVIRSEARYFGYPDCCAEAYIQDPHFITDYSAEEQSLLFHRPCPGCKATQTLLPRYRAAQVEAQRLYDELCRSRKSPPPSCRVKPRPGIQ